MRKTKTHAKQKLNHYLHQVLLSFSIQKFIYFSFLCSPSYDILKIRLKMTQSHRGFVYYRKLFFTFGLKKTVFINTTVTITLKLMAQYI